MIGLVLVSHSRAVAVALQGMVGELYNQSVPVAVAAGAGDDGALLGTDATAIMAAVEGLAATCDGVLVLLDLGSAILSAELALELLDETVRVKVAVCGAPLVEGAVAAAAQCSIGATLEAVRAEAEGALRQKTEHLGTPVEASVTPAIEAEAGTAGWAEERQTDLRVENASGLHARPAMRIVQTAAGFRSVVEIRNLRTGGPAVSARSLVALTCLDARRGDTVRVTARGDDAAAAIRAMEALHAERFGDPPEGESPVQMNRGSRSVGNGGSSSGGDPGEDKGTIRGKALSTGGAVGPAGGRHAGNPDVAARHGRGDRPGVRKPSGCGTRWKRCAANWPGRSRWPRNASARRRRRSWRCNARWQRTRRWWGPPRVPCDDAQTPAARRARLAAFACRAAADAYRRLADPLLRERAGDVEDLEERVLRALGVEVAAGSPICRSS